MLFANPSVADLLTSAYFAANDGTITPPNDSCKYLTYRTAFTSFDDAENHN